jgi:ESS family glutamate:Na+ symporter
MGEHVEGLIAALGFPGGQDLGLAMATVGLLSSTLIGGLLLALGSADTGAG